jgi:formylglycine-generating enzyme required for sulfatase activity
MDAKGARRLEPVEGRADGATPLGILRMAGNATEWTSTPRGADPGRGWTAGESFLSVPVFRSALLIATAADTRRRDLGFRCAASIPARPR